MLVALFASYFSAHEDHYLGFVEYFLSGIFLCVNFAGLKVKAHAESLHMPLAVQYFPEQCANLAVSLFRSLSSSAYAYVKCNHELVYSA